MRNTREIQLVEVLAFVAAHRLEVVDDEQVDGAEGRHLGVVRVVEAAPSQRREHLVCA